MPVETCGRMPPSFPGGGRTGACWQARRLRGPAQDAVLHRGADVDGRGRRDPDAVLLAANLGEDADTTAAVAGQIAGALYGASANPDDWLDRLAWRGRIGRMANDLFDAGIARLAA